MKDKNNIIARAVCIVLLLGLLLHLSSCHNNFMSNDITPFTIDSKDKDQFVIGVSFLDMTNPYYIESWRGIKDEAANYPIRLIMKDPMSDQYKQADDLKEFIDIGVDAIIVAALSPELVDETLLDARAQGIKVVAHSTEIVNCDIHLASDEWQMGYLLGKEAGSWIMDNRMNKTDVAILDYPRIPQIENRVKGMIDGLAEYANLAQVVVRKSASRPEEGFAATQEILKSNPSLRVILCINDGGALGALNAFESTNINTEDYFIGGIDATPEALSMINNQRGLKCTVDNNPYLTGTLDINFAMRLIKGEVVPDRYDIPITLIK